jgi:hypothetical protein
MILKSYTGKVYSLLVSEFRHVLMVDADSMPLQVGCLIVSALLFFFTSANDEDFLKHIHDTYAGSCDIVLASSIQSNWQFVLARCLGKYNISSSL